MRHNYTYTRLLILVQGQCDSIVIKYASRRVSRTSRSV